MNKLHGGRLFITDERIQQAKDTYRKAKRKNHKNVEKSEKVEVTSVQIKPDIVEENQTEIENALFASNENGIETDKEKLNRKSENFDAILAGLERDHEERDLQLGCKICKTLVYIF